MNQRARELGCTGTHFANTHGLHDDDHYTTAYDICLFTREALKHDLIREVVGHLGLPPVPATNCLSPGTSTTPTPSSPTGTTWAMSMTRPSASRLVHAGGGTLPGLCRRGRG